PFSGEWFSVVFPEFFRDAREYSLSGRILSLLRRTAFPTRNSVFPFRHSASPSRRSALPSPHFFYRSDPRTQYAVWQALPGFVTKWPSRLPEFRYAAVLGLAYASILAVSPARAEQLTNHKNFSRFNIHPL